MNRAPDMREVSGILASQIQTLAPQLLGMAPSSKSRTEWRFRTRGSMAVAVAGQDRGLWHDHEAGHGGDALDLIAYMRHCDRKEAWRWALDWLGQRPVELPKSVSKPERHGAQDEVREAQRAETARSLWVNAVSAAGSPVEAYLGSRGLKLPADAPLRFHPACPRGAERFPAMLAMMTDPESNQPVGLHRTFLKPDGCGKAEVTPAKMMLGGAGIIRLSPDETVTTGLGICEGIENGLAILQHVGWAPVWACGSAGGIAKFSILPAIVALNIFADTDDKGAGLAAAHECAERWSKSGREVTIHQPPTGTDWLDAMREALHA